MAEPDTSPARKRRRYSMPADELSARSRYAAHRRWATITDRAAATQAARDASRARWYAIPDAAGVTDPVLREQMARHAQSAYMSMLRWRQIRKQRAARLAREIAAREAGAGDGAA